MSRTRLTKVEQVMLRFGCIRCMAQPGDWCYRPGRTIWAANLHGERFDAATRAGLLPLKDGERGL